MKIAFIGQKGIPATYGGIENFVEQVATRLVKRGHSVTVFCRPYYSKDVQSPYKGINLVTLPTINSKNLDAFVHTFFSTVNCLSKGFDIINYQALGPSFFSFMPRVVNIKSKVVVTIHSLDWQRAKWSWFAKGFLRTTEYSAVYFPHCVTAVSNNLKQYFEDKFHKPVHYVASGMEEVVSRKPDKIYSYGIEPGKYFLFLNRLVPEKGCHYLINAFKAIDTDFTLVIAGAFSPKDKYITILKELIGKAKNIQFLGFVDNEFMEELFCNCYSYVLPSDLEGLPHTIIQALSYGKCVLISDIPANLETAERCGISFKRGDEKDLKDKIQMLINNPEIIRNEKQKSIDFVKQKYNWDTVVDRFEHLYLSLAK